MIFFPYYCKTIQAIKTAGTFKKLAPLEKLVDHHERKGF